ncbi:hypothetical protein HNQ64_000313 [Prosthecobacter dejongeii]|uniref:Uncharacterized protein n=1 Tax=Prosthecobacter dejongeii TaxID=48465 RepID=A0A7W8DN19_9BACT|nr:hypothetical protein [Prosthecobacter dejongeii]
MWPRSSASFVGRVCPAQKIPLALPPHRRITRPSWKAESFTPRRLGKESRRQQKGTVKARRVIPRVTGSCQRSQRARNTPALRPLIPRRAGVSGALTRVCSPVSSPDYPPFLEAPSPPNRCRFGGTASAAKGHRQSKAGHSARDLILQRIQRARNTPALRSQIPRRAGVSGALRHV